MVSNDEEEELYTYAMQLATSGCLPMALNAVIKLDVLEIIAKAGHGAQLSASEILSQLPTKNPDASVMLDPMLRLLASHSVLTCSVANSANCGGAGERAYGLAPVAKYFVKDQDGTTLGPFLTVLQDKVMMNPWYEAVPTVLEGGDAYHRAHGMSLYECAAKDPNFNETLNDGLLNLSKVVVKRVLQLYKGFENLKTLVDVGGNVGITLSMIISKYPNLKGINLDLPHAIENAPSYPGVEHVGGDMFEIIPEGDAILMKLVLLDWDDSHCVKLLKNCYKALPENGKVIVIDAITPTDADTSASARSPFMVEVLEGGKVRTEAEFRALAAKAGFKGIRLECRVCNVWVMEIYK